MQAQPAVSETRKKAYAWAELASSLAVEGLVTPVIRVRSLYTAAPMLVASKDIVLNSTTILAVAQWIRTRQGLAGLWRPLLIATVYNLLKRTKVFEKIVEKPTLAVGKALNVEDKDPKWKQIVCGVLGNTIIAGLRLVVELPFQTLMYRSSADFSDEGFVAATKALLPNLKGCPITAIKSVYAGWDMTLLGVFGGSLLMATGNSLPESKAKKFIASGGAAAAGVFTAVTDALAFRMAVSGRHDGADLARELFNAEGRLWWFRGVPLYALEQLLQFALQGVRARVVQALFQDVLDDAERQRQEHIQKVIAQLKAEQAQQTST